MTRCALAAAVLAGAAAPVRAELPSAKLVTAPAVSPTAAWTFYGVGDGHTTGPAASPATAPEIVATARSLGADRIGASPGQMSQAEFIQNVFEHVRSNIAVEFRFGLGKGALGALTDESGTPFDQAELMKALLAQGGVSAAFNAGELTLTPQEFGQWTGFVKGLGVSSNFTVSAPAACQFLADGGIPATVNGSASCTGLAGDMTTVTIAHVWLNIGGIAYDPSFKRHDLMAGIDLPAAMQCGSSAAPSCFAEARTALMTGAALGTLGGSNTIANANAAALDSQMATYAARLQGAIEAAAGGQNLPLEEVVGGKMLARTQTGYAGAPIVRRTWSAIPDQYRTTLRVDLGAFNRTLFADELGGRRLYLNTNYDQTSGGLHVSLSSDGGSLGQGLTGPGAGGVVQLTVAPPYAAAGQYGRRSFDFLRFENHLGVVLAMGESSPARASHYASLEGGAPEQGYQQEATWPAAAQYSVQQGQSNRIVAGATKTLITQHYVVGLAGNGLDLATVVSAASRADHGDSRMAAFRTSALMGGLLEGSVLEQARDAWPVLSVPAGFAVANQQGATFVDIAVGNFANVAPLLTFGVTSYYQRHIDAGSNLIAIASMPNRFISMPNGLFEYGGIGQLAYSADSEGYWANQRKGGDAPAVPDPTKAALESIKQSAAALRSAFKADLATGAINLTPAPDLVTGSGAFPESLTLQRVYSSGAKFKQNETNALFARDKYAGPDEQVLGRIGGGWLHNFQITARIAHDGLAGLGGERAVDAAPAIAAIMTSVNQPSLIGFQARMTNVFIADWVGRQFLGNAVTIQTPPKSTTFVRRANGLFAPPKGSTGQLTQTGGRSGPIGLTRHDSFPDRVTSAGVSYGGTFTYVSENGDQIYFENGRSTDYHLASLGERVFVAKAWQHLTNARVEFDYQPITYVDPEMNNHVGRSGFQLIKVRNSFGRSLTFTNSDLTLTQVTDENGRSVQFSLGCGLEQYLACDSLTVTTPGQRATRYEYETYDPAASRIRPDYRLVRWFTPRAPTSALLSFDYDELYRLKSVTDALGRVTRYYSTGVSGEERRKYGEIVDPAQARSLTIFDENNNPTRTVDPLGRATDRAYDRAGRLVRTVHPEGNAEERLYDPRSNLTRTCQIGKNRAGSGCDPNAGDLTVTTAYPEPAAYICSTPKTCNKPLTITDARGNSTSYTWSLTGLLRRVEAPASGGLSREDFTFTALPVNGANLYQLTQRQRWIRPGLTETTDYLYEATNKYVLKSATVDPTGLGLVSRFTFDGAGNLLAVDGPLLGPDDTTEYAWDADRRLSMTVLPAGAAGVRTASHNTYDPDGNLTSVRKGTATSATASSFSALTQTSMGYDAVGNKTHEAVHDGAGGAMLALSQMVYDVADRLRCSTVRMNPGAWVAAPDACTLTAGGAHGADRKTRNTYDLAGQLLTVEEAVGTEVQRTYATYAYTPNGRKASVVDAVGNRTTYEYDAFDRLKKLIHPSAIRGAGVSNPGDFEEFGYDGNGNRTSWRRRNGQTILYTYDALNRVSFKDIPGATATDVTYAYDMQNRMLSAAYPGTNNSVVYTYDNAGRLTAEKSYGRTLNFEVDALGNRTRMTWPDGNYVSYGYDSASRMISMTRNGTTQLASFAYDDLGRRARLDRPNQTASVYSYDGAGRLSQLARPMAVAGQPTASEIMTFNPASQVASATKDAPFVWQGHPTEPVEDTHDGLNRLSRLLALPTPAYDANGNLTNDGVRTYAYDVENRMVGVTAGPVTSTDEYDPLGRLRARTTSSGGATYFLYDKDRLVAEYASASATDAPLRAYVHGPNVDEPLVWYEGATPYWLHADRQGSIVAWSDLAGKVIDGSVTRIATYGPYGEPSTWSMPRFAYTGQAAIPEFQLYSYKARLYSPALGRFLQTDPVGDADDLNLYAYVRGDPINSADPTGMYKCGDSECPGAIDTAIGDIAKSAENLAGAARQQISELVKFFGRSGEDNGVNFNVGGAYAGASATADTDQNGRVTISVSESFLKGASNPDLGLRAAAAATIGHEGRHGIDGRANGGNPTTRATAGATELNATRDEFNIHRGLAAAGITSSVSGLPPAGADPAALKSAIAAKAAEAVDLWCGQSGAPKC